MTRQSPPSSSSLPTAFASRLVLAAVTLTLSATAQLRFAEHGGTMLPTKHNGSLTEINAIASADFNGDGKLDLVFASNTGSGHAAHRVLLQDALGGFHDSSTIASYESARSVACGDVNGDGHVDLLFGGGRTAYGGVSEARIVLNDGTGHFTQYNAYPALDHISVDVELADIDGDQDLDAVLFDHNWSPNPTIHVWQNDGTGSFTDITATAIGTATIVSYHAVVVDLDGDLDPDVVTAELFENKWYRNDGNGTFTEVVGWWQGSGHLLCSTDANHDGAPDLVTSNGVYRNDGAGTMTLVQSGNFPLAHAVAADFDGDGSIDVAGIEEWPVQPRLWLTWNGQFNEVTNSWFPPHALANFELDYSFGAIHNADVDGDGDPDLLTGGVEGRGTASTTVGIPPQLLVNTNGAGFVDAARPAFPHAQNQLQGMSCGDFNGDGVLDLIAGGTWLQDRSGRFDLASTALQDRGTPGKVADFDNDGDLDIVGNGTFVAQGYTFTQPLSFQANDGNANFTSTTLLPSAGLGFDIGDVDGDGDADVVASQPALGVTLLVNDGQGNFQAAPQQLPAGTFDTDVITLCDLDGDGDLDLAIAASLGWAANPTPAPVLVYTNDGAGTFTDATQNLPPLTDNHRFLVHDVDGDGDADILVDGTDLINDGSGQFTATTGGSDRFPDLDGDGQPEVVTFNSGVNVGGQFYPWCWNANCIAFPVDVDDDGDSDLVVSSYEWASYEWSLYYTGILYNLQRDLQFTALPRLGHTCRLSARATNNGGATAVLVVIGLGLLPQPVQIGSWGRMHLDPTLSVPLAVITVPDEDTAAHATMPIPADPSLLGTDLSSQGLFMPLGDPAGVRLSAVITETLLP